MLGSYVRFFRGVTQYRPLRQIRPFHVIYPPNARSNNATPNDDEATATPVRRKRGRPRKNDVAATADLEGSENGTNNLTSKSQPTTSPETKHTTENNNENESAPAHRKRGRPPGRKDNPTITRPRKTPTKTPPPRLIRPSPHHNDLTSFLAYAESLKNYKSTNVYKGTFYEYTVVAALARLHFNLHRTGRANDLGIDLVGYWHLPAATVAKKAGSKGASQNLKVLVQCKAVKPSPSMVRELEGTYVGAPAGWRGEGVLALLVASQEATKGVRDALQRSRWPMGLVQVTAEGRVRQFLWNAEAEEQGLAGLGVTVKYADEGSGKSERVEGSIALTWMGELWKGVEDVK